MQRAGTDPPREPRRQGRPPKGEDAADELAEIYANLYLREWKAKAFDVQLLYRSAQLRSARERAYIGEPDATDKAVLLLRRRCALYCGERAIQNALAMGKGNELRMARVAARILEFRLYHPDLTRLEEAEIVGKELGVSLDPSAHRRSVDAMLAYVRRYGPILLRDLAWRASETWQYYETRYGVRPRTVLRRGDDESVCDADGGDRPYSRVSYPRTQLAALDPVE